MILVFVNREEITKMLLTLKYTISELIRCTTVLVVLVHVMFYITLKTFFFSVISLGFVSYRKQNLCHIMYAATCSTVNILHLVIVASLNSLWLY